MELTEVKVIFDAENIEKCKNEIINAFYEFGVSGVKIDEPMDRNSLDYYKNEKDFVVNELAVTAYFPKNAYSVRREIIIKERFEELFGDRDDLVYNISFYDLADEDYVDNWKKYVFTTKISDRFVVKPTWRDYEKNSDELVIELDPGRAFGTGTHPTTYLCIRLMEKYIENSHTVIDVGTGSGILMVAANKLGAKEIWGVDIDPDACEVAKENLILNGITDENTKVLVGNLLNVVENKTFDVVVANILADVILMLLKDISKVIKKDGILILSGIIEDKKNLVINACEKEGLELVEVQEDKEWVALSLRMK
ncbi:MAG: 50S ribosomal protein L11 methyltransferase [Fusobacteriaceae bacterium]|nr:50S ribosomal protein L11 methyltransferase [Fusobacteriaceae bacterium]MBP9595577.1 50S ribosomal protein L11 methyltransferase [Fusobacteriaceae bacterium]MBU9917261.1 50S ribosomal protein L11 methyltransferase [Fusobacteriaceae bacterium]